MYQDKNCNCHGGLSGLGVVDWASMGMSFLTNAAGKAGGSGGGAPQMPANMNTVTTSTNVNTQVSPQISPVFIQQDQPQDSAINASASMTAAPMPGSMLPPSYNIPQPQYQTPQQINPMVIAAGIGAFLLFAVAMRRKNAGSR